METKKLVSVIVLVALVLATVFVFSAGLTSAAVTKSAPHSGDGGCGANSDWDPSVTDEEAYFKCLT